MIATAEKPPNCALCGNVIDISVPFVMMLRQLEVVSGELIAVLDVDELCAYHEDCEQRARAGRRLARTRPTATLRLDIRQLDREAGA